MNGTAVGEWLGGDEGHLLFVAEAGNPSGVPAVWIHGGPGSGFGASTWDLFDLSRHRAVCYDQRGAGRSTPHASEAGFAWTTIDMDRHLSDLEHIRQHLGFERWIVGGASWGSVLALTYAQRHRDRVIALVVAAASTGGRAEIDHLTENGAAYAPRPWRRFHDFARRSQPGVRLVEAYRRMVMDPDPMVHDAAAKEWCLWEDAHVNVDDLSADDEFVDERYRNARFRLAFARQVTHCWTADSWLSQDELIHGARTMADVPATFIHGARDRSSPLGPVQRLHEAWPHSRLVVTDDGHGGNAMWRHVADALRTSASGPP